MAINTVTDLKNTDPGQSALTVRQSPVGTTTPCHAVQITQAARSGDGAAINVVSDNTGAPAYRAKAAGPMMRLYDATNTLRFEIDNTGTITTGSISGPISVTTLNTSSDATVGGTLHVTGASTFNGTVTVVGSNFEVQGTGKGYRYRTSGSRLDNDATGADWMFSVFSGAIYDGTQRTYLRLESGTTLAHACGTWIFTDTADSGAVHTIDGSGNKLGFYGATSVGQQNVTGSRGGNAALASLITKLATLGLITDGTSA